MTGTTLERDFDWECLWDMFELTMAHILSTLTIRLNLTPSHRNVEVIFSFVKFFHKRTQIIVLYFLYKSWESFCIKYFLRPYMDYFPESRQEDVCKNIPRLF